MHWCVAVLAVGFLAPSPASAFTGADYLDTDTRFASGYAFGAIESITSFCNPALPQGTQERWITCLRDGSLMTNQMHAAVRRYIEQNPASLGEPAYVAVLKTLREVCP